MHDTTHQQTTHQQRSGNGDHRDRPTEERSEWNYTTPILDQYLNTAAQQLTRRHRAARLDEVDVEIEKRDSSEEVLQRAAVDY